MCVCVPLEGDVACVQVCRDDGRGQSLCRVLLRRQHGGEEGRRITWRQGKRLRVHHLLLMIHLHHHGPVIWITHTHIIYVYFQLLFKLSRHRVLDL